MVDDKPAVLQKVAEFLSEEGFEVIEATSGLEAFRYLKRERPDAVVLDLGMPRLGGLEALRRVRVLDPALTVVIVTDDPEDIRERAVSLGAAAVLGRPLAMRELLNALRSERMPTGVPPQSARPSPAPQTVTPATGRPPTVLVIDDDPQTGATLTDLVTRRGYVGQWVADGAAALRVLSQQTPDLVLLDLLMPGLSGLEVLPSIRALAPGVPVIVVSGVSDERLARQALAHGSFDYVVKPVDLRYLAEAMDLALTMSQLARD